MTDSRSNQRTLVYGAGAVGTLLGGLLSQAGYDVTLLGRGAPIEYVRQHGLKLNLRDRQFRTTPATVSSVDDLTNLFDVVLLTMRAFSVEKALESIPGLLTSDGVLVTMQNGIGTEEMVQENLPGIHHVAGSLTLSADIPQPGVVSSSSGSGGFAFAPVSSNAPVATIADMFAQTSRPVSTFDDYRSMKWSKLLLNQMANGIPALLGWTPGQAYRHPGVFRIEQAMLRETLQVIKADGARLVSLPGFPVPLLGAVLQLPPWLTSRLLLRRVESGRGDKLPSLLIDLQAGRRQIESDWLYGAVANRGAELGVPAPVNRRINALLNGEAHNPELREAFRDQPDRLIRNVQFAAGDVPPTT